MAETTIGWNPSRLAKYVFGVLFSALIIITALSDILVSFSPQFALTLNPINSAARIKVIVASIDKEKKPDQLADSENTILKGIALEPFDARYYSLLGIISERKNNQEKALELFQHSLKLQPTEIQALSRMFAYNVNNGNAKEAVEIGDVLFRRWPTSRPAVSRYLPLLLKDKDAYQEALTRFPTQLDGVNDIVNVLLENPSSYGIAYRMVLDWRKRNVPNLHSAINRITHRLYQAGENQKAFRLFHLTLPEAAKDETGYIHNSRFNVNTSGNIFDWKLVSKSGLRMAIVDRPSGAGGEASGLKRALKLSFGDAPVKLRNSIQKLFLPPSSFTFKLVYSTQDYKGPNPLEVAIMCSEGKLLTRVELVPNKSKATELTSRFTVPATACKNQFLMVSNGTFIESWKNRFSGSVFIYEASLKLGQ